MKIGFTGTRAGMTAVQSFKIVYILEELEVTEAHHGDCIGADEQFHFICGELGVPVILHPPENDKLRAFCPGAMMIERPLPYLIRDRLIVDRVDLLIAAPKEELEPSPQRGQGTWSTVRYARRSGTALRIVWPT